MSLASASSTSLRRGTEVCRTLRQRTRGRLLENEHGSVIPGARGQVATRWDGSPSMRSAGSGNARDRGGEQSQHGKPNQAGNDCRADGRSPVVIVGLANNRSGDARRQGRRVLHAKDPKPRSADPRHVCHGQPVARGGDTLGTHHHDDDSSQIELFREVST